MSNVIDMGAWLVGRANEGSLPPSLRRPARPNLEAAIRALLGAGYPPASVKGVARTLDRAHVGPDRDLSAWLRDFEARIPMPPLPRRGKR